MPPQKKIDEKRIKELAAKGVKPTAIAVRAGVSTQSVYRVLRAK